MEQRRKATRKRTLKKGRIAFNNRHSVIECTVRNLTREGALLLVPSLAGIPDDFDLVIDSDGTEHHARIVWKRDGQLGVQFG